MEEAEVSPSQEGRETSGGCPILQIDMSIGYNGEASRRNDSTTITESHGWREQSLADPVRLSEMRVHSGRYPDSSGYRH